MITPQPSPDVIYYVDGFTGKCANSIDAPMSHSVVNDATNQFTDYRECCLASFVMKEECFVRGPYVFPPQDPTLSPSALPSSLPSTLPSSLPTVQPTTPLPTVQPTKEDCTDDKWRYDPDYVSGCTNLVPGDNDSDGPYLLFQSWKECCQRFFSRGNHCRVDDRCSISATTISFTSRPRMDADCMNDNAQYHPDAKHKDGCTNSASFPATWLELPEPSMIFFSTVEQCCQTLYLDTGYDCNVRNICGELTTPPTNSPIKTLPQASCDDRQWHPDIASDSDGCSNSENIPDSWKRNILLRETMLFGTAEECCQEHYALYGLWCNVNDVCSEETQSFPHPSSGDISHSNSSCSSRRWHPNKGFSKCTNALGGSSSSMFDDATACCMQVFNYPNCPMEDVCTSTGQTTTPSISSCESHKWHPNTDFSKCTNDVWEGPSILMFDDAAVCCMNAFNYDNCPTEDVCASGAEVITSPPSSRPTPSPTPTLTTQTPTPTPTTQSPTPNPNTPAPTTNLPTKTPTNRPSFALIYGSSTLDDRGPKIPCGWRTMAQCKSRSCIWDTSKKSCVVLGELSPTPAVMMGEAPSDRCGGKNKRQCANDMYCSWDNFADSCTCGSDMYHPRSAHDRTCSNDGKYPALWNEPIMRDEYFFTSGLECCAAHYKDGPCKVVDICLYCNGRKWHPLTATARVCTNSDEYPPLWDTPQHSKVYLLNSASECCAAFYGDGKCNEIDVCDT